MAIGVDAIEKVYSAESTWRRGAIDGGKPYSLWHSPQMPWWCVLDRNGVNVLSNGTGQVFTSEDVAKQLLSEWNA